MSELTAKRIKNQHAVEIDNAETFETHRVSEKSAQEYLVSKEGKIYLSRLIEADPTATASEIRERAVGQLRSGIDLPRMEISGEPLHKIIPTGNQVEAHSPFFGKERVFDGAQSAGKSLSDFFALPIKSESAVYDEMVMRPLAPTEIFVHRVAPTTELGGLTTKVGGGEQVLVPNRKLYAEPTYLKSIDDSLALQAERRLGTSIKGTVASAGVVLAGYDAYSTAEQYQSLSTQGNQFGADALLRRYEGRTAGGFVGSFTAGAAYGMMAGSEIGPGAFLTGAVGGVVGAFAGEKIATMVNEHKINHQTGTDGVSYAYENGQWGRTQHHMDLNSAGSANPYDAPNYTSTTTPAPTEQLAQLEYQRMTAVTALALANPATHNTKHFTFDCTDWRGTHDGWMRRVALPGVQNNSFGIPSAAMVNEPPAAKTRAQLIQMAAHRDPGQNRSRRSVTCRKRSFEGAPDRRSRQTLIDSIGCSVIRYVGSFFQLDRTHRATG